jgi:hypothetical protein
MSTGFFQSGGGGNNMLSSMPLIGGMFDNSEAEALDQLKQNQANWNGLEIPNETWDTVTPQLYSAQQANATTVQNDPMVKSAQMAALAKMGDLANTGLSDVDQQGYTQARDLGNQMANSGSQAAMQNAQARGIGGSGMEFANREIANQQGAQRAQQAGLQQAADSARQRALYNQAYATGLGNMQQQDTNLSAQNAGILNQFNMANTQAANQGSQYNIANNYNSQIANNQGRTGVQQNMYGDAVTRAQGQSGANSGMAQGYGAVNAANNSARNTNTDLAGEMMGF